MANEKLKQKAEEYAYARRKSLHLSQRDTNLIQLAYLHGLEELEEQNKKIFDDWLEACTKYGEVNLKLTKATEIIKKLIEAIHIWDCKNLEQVEVEAEQFLEEATK